MHQQIRSGLVSTGMGGHLRMGQPPRLTQLPALSGMEMSTKEAVIIYFKNITSLSSDNGSKLQHYMQAMQIHF